ncbi:hypothetical protein L1887_35116 [Cichorium endivia]|nr:hypothetical protein L1887_35116 [Cichorium endivia]
MYRRDRLILLKYLLSGTLIKKVVMPAGAVSLDDVDLHQVSVDFVLNSVKKFHYDFVYGGMLELSEAIRDYHDSTGYPHMRVALLNVHLDFSFASTWYPDGYTFATGNQDKTCRVWDVRHLFKSITALKANFGAIRSIRYSSDGQFMAMAKPTDFVHVFDVKNGYEKEQESTFLVKYWGRLKVDKRKAKGLRPVPAEDMETRDPF